MRNLASNELCNARHPDEWVLEWRGFHNGAGCRTDGAGCRPNGAGFRTYCAGFRPYGDLHRSRQGVGQGVGAAEVLAGGAAAKAMASLKDAVVIACKKTWRMRKPADDDCVARALLLSLPALRPKPETRGLDLHAMLPGRPRQVCGQKSVPLLKDVRCWGAEHTGKMLPLLGSVRSWQSI